MESWDIQHLVAAAVTEKVALAYPLPRKHTVTAMAISISILERPSCIKFIYYHGLGLCVTPLETDVTDIATPSSIVLNEWFMYDSVLLRWGGLTQLLQELKTVGSD